MNNRSRSALFLMEQLIVITIFAVCAAACVKIFVVSYIMVSDSRDLNHALPVAESGAECFKAAAGDAEKVTMILGGSVNADMISVFYDEQWQTCGEDSASFVMRLMIRYPVEALSSPVFGDISVEKITGEEIIAFTVAAGVDTR